MTCDHCKKRFQGNILKVGDLVACLPSCALSLRSKTAAKILEGQGVMISTVAFREQIATFRKVGEKLEALVSPLLAADAKHIAQAIEILCDDLDALAREMAEYA